MLLSLSPLDDICNTTRTTTYIVRRTYTDTKIDDFFDKYYQVRNFTTTIINKKQIISIFSIALTVYYTTDRYYTNTPLHTQRDIRLKS